MFRALPKRPNAALPSAVASGLDVGAVNEEDGALRWIHEDIIDPWAGRASFR